MKRRAMNSVLTKPRVKLKPVREIDDMDPLHNPDYLRIGLAHN